MLFRSTHLYDLAYAHYGPNAPKATAWVHQREDELLSAHPERARRAISRLRPQTPEAKGKREENLRYFEKNQSRMHYRTYQQNQWPIGSGGVEGAARTFVGARMKVGGGKWVKDNAQFVLDLRSVIESNRWDSFWSQRFSPN